jgi:hypothetical protein
MCVALALILGGLSFILGELPEAAVAAPPIAGAIIAPPSPAIAMSCVPAIPPAVAMVGAMLDGAMLDGAMLEGAIVGAMLVVAIDEALAIEPVDCILSSGLSHAHASRRMVAKPILTKFMGRFFRGWKEFWLGVT